MTSVSGAGVNRASAGFRISCGFMSGPFTEVDAAGEGGAATPRTVARKEELRREFRSRLATVEPGLARAAAASAAERLAELIEERGARGILACLSFGDEIDTWGLVDRLGRTGCALYVPRAEPRDRQLHVHRWPCELRTLEFGLRQPPRGAPELPDEEIEGAIDLALVLGLAFDRHGIRLGHGSGYFDRFLARHPLFAVGVAFDFQLVDELPRAAHDRPMAAVVTERGVRRMPPA